MEKSIWWKLTMMLLVLMFPCIPAIFVLCPPPISQAQIFAPTALSPTAADVVFRVQQASLELALTQPEVVSGHCLWGIHWSSGSLLEMKSPVILPAEALTPLAGEHPYLHLTPIMDAMLLTILSTRLLYVLKLWQPWYDFYDSTLCWHEVSRSLILIFVVLMAQVVRNGQIGLIVPLQQVNLRAMHMSLPIHRHIQRRIFRSIPSSCISSILGGCKIRRRHKGIHMESGIFQSIEFCGSQNQVKKRAVIKHRILLNSLACSVKLHWKSHFVLAQVESIEVAYISCEERSEEIKLQTLLCSKSSRISRWQRSGLCSGIDRWILESLIHETKTYMASSLGNLIWYELTLYNMGIFNLAYHSPSLLQLIDRAGPLPTWSLLRNPSWHLYFLTMSNSTGPLVPISEHKVVFSWWLYVCVGCAYDLSSIGATL